MKKATYLLKKITMTIILIYSLNIILEKINIVLPINYVTISIASLLGIPGLLAIIVVKLL